MKALTIKQPYIDSILSGEKTIELRTRRTSHRGLFLLHCSRQPHSTRSGEIVAICTLKNCREACKEDSERAMVDESYIRKPMYAYEIELYYVFTRGWVEKGQLGFWNCEVPFERGHEVAKVESKDKQLLYVGAMVILAIFAVILIAVLYKTGVIIDKP